VTDRAAAPNQWGAASENKWKSIAACRLQKESMDPKQKTKGSESLAPILPIKMSISSLREEEEEEERKRMCYG
jgi:hypothetical protein